MTISTEILLPTFFCVLHFQSARGYPGIIPEHIIVKMEDNTVYQGDIAPYNSPSAPPWMNRGPEEHNPETHGFIRTQDEKHYIFVLHLHPPVPNYYPVGHIPELANIRLRNNECLTAQNFHVYVTCDQRSFNSGQVALIPENNYVYISVPFGPIYRSNLSEILIETERVPKEYESSQSQLPPANKRKRIVRREE